MPVARGLGMTWCSDHRHAVCHASHDTDFQEVLQQATHHSICAVFQDLENQSLGADLAVQYTRRDVESTMNRHKVHVKNIVRGYQQT